MSFWWPEPAAGEIAWCHFPQDMNPRPKARPVLVLTVFDDDAPRYHVRVAYGTSQRTTTLYTGEFAITKARNPAAFASAGLSFDTKFNFKQVVDLPYSDESFSVPPAAPFGQSPTLGLLHPTMTRIAAAAFEAATVSARRR